MEVERFYESCETIDKVIEAMQERCNMTSPQAQLMVKLFYNEKKIGAGILPYKDITEASSIKPSSFSSTVITPLQVKGYISSSRMPEIQSRRIAVLTKEGSKLIDEIINSL